ncbi:hypothetical protein Tco_1581845 [Tanacetum coccineum]
MSRSSIFIPSAIRLTSINPALESLEMKAPFVYNFHVFSGFSSSFIVFWVSISLLYVIGISTKKSAKICPLMELHPLNLISCSSSFIAHLATRPDFLGLASSCFMGLSISIWIGAQLMKEMRICFFPFIASKTTLILSSETARSEISFTFEELALIPCFVIRYPRNGPSSTPKEHFMGLSFILIARSLSKVSWMSASMSSSKSLFITMSSTWTSRFYPI